MNIEAMKAAALAATQGEWQVIQDEHPHHLGGAHQERRIFTTLPHPQMKGPLPVVNGSIGIGPVKGSPGIHMVSISEADATHIAAFSPAHALKLIALVEAAKTYYERYAQDEADDALTQEDRCAPLQQCMDAAALRDALKELS